MAVGKRRMTKVDKWIVALGGLSRRYGIALVETWDGMRIQDTKTGKELGRSVQYICGLYTSHRAASYKRKQKDLPPAPKDTQGFVTALNALSEDVGVRLQLRSAPVLLVDIDTMQPVGRLIDAGEGFIVEELLPV